MYKQILLLVVCLWPLCVTAQTYLGGLHSMRSPHLLIEREDISIGPEQVRVSYIFKNTSQQNIIETMGFTLPQKYAENFRQFSVTVNQIPIQYQIIQRAITPAGQDISAQLKTMGVPFNPITAIHHIDASANRDSIITKLRTLNLIDKKEDLPIWRVKTFYYWQQDFPPNSETHIEQTYKPIVNIAHLNFNTINNFVKLPVRLIKKAMRMAINLSFADQHSAAEILQEQFEKYSPQIKAYCPTKLDYQALTNAYKGKNQRKPQIEIKELHFATDLNDAWANVVNHFSLTIENTANMHPLLCWHDQLQPGNNNTLVFNAENYVPLHDVKIMYIEK